MEFDVAVGRHKRNLAADCCAIELLDPAVTRTTNRQAGICLRIWYPKIRFGGTVSVGIKPWTRTDDAQGY
jgi:hypothetical protein